MKSIFSKNELKKIAKQVSVDHLPVDELEDFIHRYHHLDKTDLTGLIWKEFGSLGEMGKSQVVTFFTTKGGVLKTSLAFNFARFAALSGKKTLVVGLDMQSDMTNCLLGEHESDQEESLHDALDKMDQHKGLFEYFNREVSLEETIQKTDLKNLFFIAESPKLALLNDGISLLNRREYWLRDKVVNPLRDQFDFIIFDCSPNWNRLTTNALCSCDLLISPIECKINNFKNLEVFQALLSEIKSDLMLTFNSLYVPTRYSKGKKLGHEILEWYQDNISNCTRSYIRESIESEEAIALGMSIIEYRPASKCADDFKAVFKEISENIKRKEAIANGPVHQHFSAPIHAQTEVNTHGPLS